MDGKYLNGTDEIFVIGEVTGDGLIGVTYNNDKNSLKDFLQKNIIDENKTVKAISMDMSKLLKGVACDLFPGVPIVSDKFHVIKLINHCIDLCRVAVEKGIQERLQIKRMLVMKTETFEAVKDKPKWSYKIKKFTELLETNNDIKLLWDLKNKIHDFYKSDCRKNGEIKLDEINQFLNTNRSIHPEFDDLHKTLNNWRKEILNYFDYRITNATIEGINNRIETHKRKKFGFRNKENLIKTILYSLLPIALFIPNLILTH